jgi:N-acetylglutamate synthase-like GNAT family acetyltransferase
LDAPSHTNPTAAQSISSGPHGELDHRDQIALLPPMAFTFRAATKLDLPAIAAVIDAAYSHYIPILGGRKPRPMTDDHAARIDRGETFLLEEDDRPIAVTSMALRDGAMHIFNIAVHPDAQGSGHLRGIFAFAEDRSRGEGATRLTLFTNALMERNRAIYSHMGFAEVREEDAPGGYRIVFMERPIAPA